MTFILGVSGGSGSGKTYFARRLQELLPENSCSLVYQDNFYIDQSHRFDFDGGSVNFDHPDSIDFPLLAKKLKMIKEGDGCEIPLYDFATHSRLKQTERVESRPIILVDGILILHHPAVREVLDKSVFFDTSKDLRFSRRLKRDVEERGRTAEGVKNQFEIQVEPMHQQFVQPSKEYADWLCCDPLEFGSVLLEVKNFLDQNILEKSKI